MQYAHLLPPRRLCFWNLCLSVCLCVCDQHNWKTDGRIWLKFCMRIPFRLRTNWLNFGGSPRCILPTWKIIKRRIRLSTQYHRLVVCRPICGRQTTRRSTSAELQPWRRFALSERFLVFKIFLMTAVGTSFFKLGTLGSFCGSVLSPGYNENNENMYMYTKNGRHRLYTWKIVNTVQYNHTHNLQ